MSSTINLLRSGSIAIPRSGTASEAEVDAVERLLMRAARQLLFEDDADSPLWDLPVPQIRALHVLHSRENCHMGHLAERLGVAMSTATQIADRLEQRGWVQRVDDPEDRRVVRLTLTDEGRGLLEHRRLSRRERLRGALWCMSIEDRSALLDGLRALQAFGGSAKNHGCRRGSSVLDWVREELEPDPGSEETNGAGTASANGG
jgi:DNA-binding MarR family transcriptional regulator